MEVETVLIGWQLRLRPRDAGDGVAKRFRTSNESRFNLTKRPSWSVTGPSVGKIPFRRQEESSADIYVLPSHVLPRAAPVARSGGQPAKRPVPVLPQPDVLAGLSDSDRIDRRR